MPSGEAQHCSSLQQMAWRLVQKGTNRFAGFSASSVSNSARASIQFDCNFKIRGKEVDSESSCSFQFCLIIFFFNAGIEKVCRFSAIFLLEFEVANSNGSPCCMDWPRLNALLSVRILLAFSQLFCPM
jgi:hypothetical protein